MSDVVERAMRQIAKLETFTPDAEKIAAVKRAIEYAEASMPCSASVIDVFDSRERAVAMEWRAGAIVEWRWPARAEPARVILRVSRDGIPGAPLLYRCSASWRPNWREGGVSRFEKFHADEEERAFAWVVRTSAETLAKIEANLRGRGRHR